MENKFSYDKYMKDYKKRVLTRLTMDMKKEKRDEIQQHADRCGETLTGYIKRAIEMRMAIDDYSIALPEEGQTEARGESVARNEELVKSYGKSIGDIGKVTLGDGKKKGRIVKDGEHGFRVVYLPDDKQE